MPEIGERTTGSAIGKSEGPWYWVRCPGCEAERWAKCRNTESKTTKRCAPCVREYNRRNFQINVRASWDKRKAEK